MTIPIKTSVNMTFRVAQTTGVLDKPNTHLLLTFLPELQRFPIGFTGTMTMNLSQGATTAITAR
jgi:hypothetical protein